MAVLQVTDLSKRYRNGTLANDNLSLAVERGEVYGLLGPNGAGKTTLVKQILGLLKPTTGFLTVDSVDVVDDPGFARRNIGYCNPSIGASRSSRKNADSAARPVRPAFE